MTPAKALSAIAYACDNVSPMAPREDLYRRLKKIGQIAEQAKSVARVKRITPYKDYKLSRLAKPRLI